MYSIDIWYLGTDLVPPHKETPSSAQPGVGGDDGGDGNFSSIETQRLQVDAGVEESFLKCYMNSTSRSSSRSKCQHSFQVSGVAAGMTAKRVSRPLKSTTITRRVHWIYVAVAGVQHVHHSN